MKYEISIYQAIDSVRESFSLPDEQEPVYVKLERYTNDRGIWWKIVFEVQGQVEIRELVGEINAMTDEIIHQEKEL